jgi:hypothetical protein
MRCFWIGSAQEKLRLRHPLGDAVGKRQLQLLTFPTEVIDRQFQNQQGYTRQQDRPGFVK